MHRTIRQGTELAHQARGLDPALPARGRRGRQSPVLAAPPNLPPLTGLRLHTARGRILGLHWSPHGGGSARHLHLLGTTRAVQKWHKRCKGAFRE